MHKQRIPLLSAGPARFGDAVGKATAVFALALIISACQSSSKNPRLESQYVGQSSAAFFEAYGPPDQVIGLKQKLKKDPTGKIVDQTDPKELVYYWSSTNSKTYSKVPKPAGDTCNLAILTSAEGEIKRIEVQDENGNIEAVKAKCEALIK